MDIRGYAFFWVLSFGFERQNRTLDKRTIQKDFYYRTLTLTLDKAFTGFYFAEDKTIYRMPKNLYIDAEWFPNQELFLIGYARENAKVYQLYGRSLTKKRFVELLKETTGYIFFYGPDIALCENYFDIDIRNNYKCVNLLRVTRVCIPNAKNWKLEHMEKVFKLKRNEAKYKKSIFQIYDDWRDYYKRLRVLSYNRDDVHNLVIIKQKLFERFEIDAAYLQSILLK